MGALSSDKGLKALTFPHPTPEDALRELSPPEAAEYSPKHFRKLAEVLSSYFKGRQAEFGGKLDLGGHTVFDRRIWEITLSIPHGETRSYKWVAETAGYPRAYRAAGQALGRNPLPIIIPCHRVLASGGGKGGYGGGLPLKVRLLVMEAGAEGVASAEEITDD